MPRLRRNEEKTNYAMIRKHVHALEPRAAKRQRLCLELIAGE